MPFGLAGHCMTKLNDSFAIVVGGRIARAGFDNITSYSYFFSWTLDSWQTGPNLLTPREGHACGAISDPKSSSIYLVIAGGFRSASKDQPALDVTEIIVFTQTQPSFEAVEQRVGPSLPNTISFSRLARIGSGSKLVLLGGTGPTGYHDTIYEWSCEHEFGCKFALKNQKLTLPRSGFIALNVNETCVRGNPDVFVEEPSVSSLDNTCSSIPQNPLLAHTVSRQLCCHGGNLCLQGDGSCHRDADCLGNLVCGCNNCNAGLYSVFGVSDNCCSDSEESCHGTGSPFNNDLSSQG